MTAVASQQPRVLTVEQTRIVRSARVEDTPRTSRETAVIVTRIADRG